MKRFVLSFLAFFSTAAPLAHAALPEHPRPAYVEGKVIVKYREGVDTAQVMAKRGLGLRRVNSHRDGRIETLALPAMTTVAQILPMLRADPSIEYAEADAVRLPRSATPVPNDPLFASQWGLYNTGQLGGLAGADMDLLDAWDPAHDGTFPGVGDGSAVVAIIDDSVLVTHEDLAANMVAGFDFKDNDTNPNPRPGDFHGTLVAGCIGAVGNNGKGVAGVAWNVKLMPLRFAFDTDSFLSAMDFAKTNHANIVNASFGGPTYAQSEVDEIQALADADILFVAAAGNDDSDTDVAQLNYPANYPVANIVSAAATNRDDQIAGFSQYGPITTDVAAPGVAITTTANGGYASSVTGTSFAAPYTSGVAALLKMKFPTATYGELKARLIEGAEPADNAYLRTASGRLNAANSLGLATPQPSLVISAVNLDGNHVLDPGEDVVISVTLTNLWADATNVAATLTPSQGLGASDGSVDFGTIASNSSVTRDFHVTVPGGFPTHQYVDFALAVTADGYSAQRHFLEEIGTLSTTKVTQAFASPSMNPYDDFHAWHFDLAALPPGDDQLVIETTAPADIDLLVRKDTPPVYDISLGINPEVEPGFFCTWGKDDNNCQDPATLISGGVCGNERVVIDNPAPGTYHAVVVNFAQLPGGLLYTLHAYTRHHPAQPDPPLCAPPSGGGGGAPGPDALLFLSIAAWRRRRGA